MAGRAVSRGTRYGMIAGISLFGLLGLAGAVHANASGFWTLLFMGGCFYFLTAQIRGLFSEVDETPVVDVMPGSARGAWVLLVLFCGLFMIGLLWATDDGADLARTGLILLPISTVGGFLAMKRAFDLEP